MGAFLAFLAFLLQGLPLIGPLIGKGFDAFTNFTNKRMDTDLEKYKVKGTVDVEALKQDTEIIKARTDLAIVMKDDPATKSGRYYFIHGTGLYYVAVLWDSTRFTRNLFEIGVLEIPHWLQYMPYAVIAYLFVTAWKK